jgi:hypothetical protein
LSPTGQPGHVFSAELGKTLELQPELILNTRDKIDYLDIIYNGQTDSSIRLDQLKDKNGLLPTVKFKESGWFVIRAVTTENKTFRYAMSAPFYVEIDYRQRISAKAVKFFLDWVNEELKPLEKPGEKLSPEQEQYRDQWIAAREFWESRLKKANAE